MAGVQDAALTVAVSNAGGLGSLPCGMLSAELLTEELHVISSQTQHPYNVNFFCHEMPAPDALAEQRWLATLDPYFVELGIELPDAPQGASRVPFDRTMAEVLSAFKPAVVSFHFGLPHEDLLRYVRSWGAKVMSSTTTVAEAIYLERQGADVVIAQGLEAGGHRGMFLTDDVSTQMGTLPLTSQMIRAVNIPVVAAGGIATAADVAAMMTLGAAGVQVGTSYLLCDEAKTSTLHRQALQSADAAHTALTNLFSGRPARGIVNRLMRDLNCLNSVAPQFPLASSALAPLRAQAEKMGKTDFSALWAGQNVHGCQQVLAAQLTRSLCALI